MDEPRQYLQTLLAHHYSSSSLATSISQIHHQFQDRIVQGEFDIHSTNYPPRPLEPSQFRERKHSLEGQLAQAATQLKHLQPSHPLSEEERRQFVKRLQREQAELKKKREEQARQQEMKMIMEREQERLERDRKNSLKKEQRRREIQRRLMELEQVRERREEDIREQNRELQAVASEKTLLQRMQESYRRSQNLEQEEKRRQLDRLRQLHKPIEKGEFELHQQRIEEFKAIQAQQKQHNPSQIGPTPQFYKSHWYQQVTNEDRLQESRLKEEDLEALKLLKDNQKKYGEYVRHNFQPESDDKLAEEIAKRTAQPPPRKKAKEVRQMGLNNLKYSKEKIAPPEQLAAKSQPPPPQAPQKTDYLQQIKARRRNSLQEKFLSGSHTSLREADKLQQQARRGAALQRAKKEAVGPEVDELYMKALNAKLSLLNK